MKRLSIKWVPETVMMVSLTIANPQNTSVESAPFELAPGDAEKSVPCSKLIVISGGSVLHARVVTAVPFAAA